MARATSRARTSTEKKSGITIPDDVIGADGVVDLDAAAKALRAVDETASRLERRSSIAIPGVISTRNAVANAVIGQGGIPLSRITVVHGKEASGKTTLLLQALAEVQAMGGIAAMIDREHKLDVDYAYRLGFDVEKAILSHAMTQEDGLKFIEGAIAIAKKVRLTKKVAVPMLIVLDSINALVPKAWLEKEPGEDQRVGLQASMWSRALPRINEMIAREHVAVVLISQVRKKIGVLFGPDEDIAGGNAVKFYASLILETTRAGTLKFGDEPVGSTTRFATTKNSIAAPFRRGEAELRFGLGFDHDGSMFDRAYDLGVLEKNAGNRYYFGGAEIAHGRANAVAAIRADAELRQLLSDRLWQAERFRYEAPKVPPAWTLDDDGEPDFEPATDDDDEGVDISDDAAPEPPKKPRAAARAEADAAAVDKMRGSAAGKAAKKTRGRAKAKAKA